MASMVLGVVAVAVGAYAYVETYPNYLYAWRAFQAGETMGLDLLASYKEVLGTQLIFGMWGAGGLALVLGLTAALKGKHRLGFAGAALGALAAVISLFTPMLQW